MGAELHRTGTPVRLNIYDLTDSNSVAYWCGLGAFHTGVEVYGVEYAFGGHSYDVSGLFATEPLNPPGSVVFRESIEMGCISLSPQEVQTIVAKLGEEYKGNKYHLLTTNCNHFADDLCYQLTGKHAPKWINRLAGMASVLEMLLPMQCLPPLTPPAPPQDEEVLLAANGRVSSAPQLPNGRV